MAVLQERIERLFDKIDAHIVDEEDYRRTLEARVEKQDVIIALLTKEANSIALLVERYKGALGLLAIIGSALVAGITLLKDWIIPHFK